VCDRQRFTIRTSDEIINRIEALAGISGESKNSVANVLLAIQLGGVTCGATSKKTKGGSNSEEPQESSVVHDDGDNNSSEKSGAKRNKRVSPPTPPSSQKKKNIPKGISQKEKVSRVGRRPKDIDEVIEYFVKRSIPDPVKPKAEKFFAFYETNGWVQGKNKPIRNWHSCLTTWLLDDRCPDDWKPKKQATTNVKLKDVLQWMQDEHPEWYEKFKDAKNINEIDGYYIDEFRGA
jgi:hypothetical protein